MGKGELTGAMGDPGERFTRMSFKAWPEGHGPKRTDPSFNRRSSLINWIIAAALLTFVGIPQTGYAQTPVVVKDAIQALRAARTAEAAEMLGSVGRTTRATEALTKTSRETAAARLRAYNPCGGGQSGECLAKLLGDVQKAGTAAGLEGTQIEGTLLKAIENAALGRVAETTRLLEEANGLAALEGVKLPKDLAAEISDSAFIFSSQGLRSLNQGELKLFRELAYSDPVTKARIADVLGDTDALIKSVGDVGGKALEERLVWVPLASNEGLRRVFIRTILDDFATRSEGLKTALTGAEDAGKAWDVVYIGAGPHSASAANALTRANPMTSQLVIEAEDAVSANFFKGGRVFAINSSNRAEVAGTLAKPGGVANINPIEGPVGVPDLSGLKYPEGRTIADASTVALASSNSDVLFNTAVRNITRAPEGAPAKYLIEIDSGVNGVTSVYANKVVFSSGLGKEFVGIGDASTKRLIQSEIAKVDYANPDAVPGILTFDQFKRLADLSKRPRDAYRSAERIAVVGLGDSGRVTNEFLLGEGPMGGYDTLGTLDRAQRGPIAGIDWIVGNSGPRNAAEYSQGVKNGTYPGSRPRYARLTNPIRKADQAIKRGELPGQETIRLVQGNLSKIRVKGRGANRRFELTVLAPDGTETVTTVDKVILATGFRNQTGDFVADLLPEGTELTTTIERSGVLSRVRGELADGSNAFVAKRIPGEDVYFIGPAAGDDLPAKAAKAGISENGASLFNLIPRSTSLARNQLAAEAMFTPVRPVAPEIVEVTSKRSAQWTLETTSFDIGKLPEGYEAFTAKVEMAKTLDTFRFPGTRSISITFERSGSELVLKAPENQALADAIQNNEALMSLAQRLTATGKPVTFSAEIRGSSAAQRGLEAGGVRFDTLSLSY